MKRSTTILMMLLLCTAVAEAQIKIGGNVYGGGNQGEVKGSTKVTVYQGDLNKVFGGARMANVGGNAYVNIDGANASDYMLINHVYGGNDIAGTIGTAAAVNETLPKELANNPDNVDNTWNTYVHLSTKLNENTGEAATDAKKVFIGQLFAGGNGDYEYVPNGDPVTTGTGETAVTKQTYNVYHSPKNEGDPVIATIEVEKDKQGKYIYKPELDKTYLDVQGGTIAFAYGGGNNATVNKQTVIHVDNPSKVVNELKLDAASNNDEANGTDILQDNNRVKNQMGIHMAQEHFDSPDFQMGRLFGGNNKVEMAIRPTWNLQRGKIRNLYSGGNRGNMTSPEGLLLEINPSNSPVLVVDNVYGGCRMADVVPTVNGAYKPCTNLTDTYEDGTLKYKFPDQLSARVLIRGGDINNVYGGNDVRGTVYGGNAVGIYSSIRGDVYGGGNGAYAYTNLLENDDDYGDYYYSGDISNLNANRPNAEQVSIRLAGTEEYPTVIQGSVYVGGNCASLATTIENPLVELKIGSHVIADQVFLGNNGEKMVDPDVLKLYANEGFSSLNLKNSTTFAGYMDGVVMKLQPSIVFDATPDDPADYEDYTTKIGSFYCGGNVGSMAIPGKNRYKVDRGLIIFEKFVAGCNNANVPEGTYNAAYEGGVLGASNERGDNTTNPDFYTDTGAENGKIKDRIELDLDNLTIEPRRWEGDVYTEVTTETAKYISEGNLIAGEAYYTAERRSSRFIATGNEVVGGEGATTFYKLTEKGTSLGWNTFKWDDTKRDFVPIGIENSADNANRRLLGGNVYGGCYNSGHVNGNVVINIKDDVIKKDEIFEEADEEDPYAIANGIRNSGVLIEPQGDDVQAVTMSVFGGGYGKDSEIWGSTTINHTNGYAFQLFGGGEQGVVGKKVNGTYTYNAAYSTTINLAGPNDGYSEEEDGPALAESEYIYGGGNEGDVCGDTYVYLGNGRVYDAFGGACNANVLGHTEVYIGYDRGFPWVRDNVYGGNDFGGTVKGYKENISGITSRTLFDNTLLNSGTYVKYTQGRVDRIFGGSFGNYDYNKSIYSKYTDDNGVPREGFNFPHLDNNSFVHFQPVEDIKNEVGTVFGGSEGYPGDEDMNNLMQQESYVLIDDTKTTDPDRFASTDVYGGGSYAGVGVMLGSNQAALGAGRTVIDLFAGRLNNVYGGSNQEGLIGYTRVNVPAVSTIQVNALYGGGKGYDPEVFEDSNNPDYEPALAARYCDNYVTCIDYQSPNAAVENGIYGGNRNCRIAFDTYINIGTAVKNREGKLTAVYGAGYGRKTSSGRTNVYLNNGAQVNEVYGGGRDGNAFNFESLKTWLGTQFAKESSGNVTEKVVAYGGILQGFRTYLGSTSGVINLPSPIPAYSDNLWEVSNSNLVDTKAYYNTNVHIVAGAEVKGNPKASGGTDGGYVYGGGLGTNAVVAGTTCVELKGGYVEKDIYGGGTSGPVFDEFKLGPSALNVGTNVFIEGGTCRNVYGGGWRGHVGYAQYKDGDKVLYQEKDGSGNVIETHKEQIPDFGENYANDILGESNIVIGKIGGTSYTDGIPAITRNVYGGGEGGAIFGTAHVTINNGYIGYRYKDNEYVEELDDYLEGDKKLEKNGGNVFGGGYVANSYVDNSDVKMYGGTIRGGLFGGGEIGPIGRGTVKDDTQGTTYPTRIINNDAKIYKAGSTRVEMFGGQVNRNVFGGGRGYDNWGAYGWMSDVEKATMDLSSKGYVFGNTEVLIHGGKIGSKDAASYDDGNVFGGGDEGFVYSATGTKNTTDGYYYGSNSKLTEDCKVVISPYCQVKTAYTDHAAGTYVETADLNTYDNGNVVWNNLDQTGIDIANAVFAGGNISAGSDKISVNTTTVFGNATASVTDVFAKDLITIGEDGVGGLYGDGNLTFVDGYRELNITNYGTDYYNLDRQLSLDQYNKLTDRERAYFELLYKAQRQRQLQYYESKGTHVDETTHISYKRGQKILKATYDALSPDERKNWSGNAAGTGPKEKTYNAGDRITQDEYNLFWDEEKNEENWTLYGFCTLYAGRMINTIQRADFCGVFGSRVVMRGAQDRVPKTVDYTEYTINRVGEVSLNKQYHHSYPNQTADPKLEHGHGNYFGIYNVVNYLGALTSDVNFYEDARTTSNTETTYKPDGKTYYEWKRDNIGNRKRNNGSSVNEVALASGVWLELLDESTEARKEKVYGPITGVVELTLINVAPGEGGGYVYAKNEHGARSNSGNNQVTLAAANNDARSYKMYTYADPITPSQAATINAEHKTVEILVEDSNHKQPGEDGYVNTYILIEDSEGRKPGEAGYVETHERTYEEGYPIEPKVQTSGNFVNSMKRIIDDCYPKSGAYYTREGGEQAAPAHYWYIRGDYYVYDQYISAYTGSSQAYAENVSIPLTITAESQGKLTLTQIQPNYYAYWSNYENIETQYKSQIDPTAIIVGGTTYKLNDPIDYWTYSHLSDTEKSFFTAKTWVCSNDATYGGHNYKKGDVLDTEPDDVYVCKVGFSDQGTDYSKGTVLTRDQYDALSNDHKNDCAAVFNVSNAVTNDNGFLLTFDWDNPDIWNDYYHHETTDETVHASKYNSVPAGYVTSPSFAFKTAGSTVLGQMNYTVGDIIDATTYQYEITNIAAPGANGDMVSKKDPSNNDLVDASTQAKFDIAYIATATENFTIGNVTYVPNACISKATYNSLSTADQSKFAAGKLCTTTYEYTVSGDTRYIVAGTLIPISTYNTLGTDKDNFFTDGYICTKEGKWGGSVYSGGQHYPAISYCNLSKDDRTNFTYNYDALDLLVDQDYHNEMSLYDKPNTTPAIYSDPQSIDYEATYTGSDNLTISTPIVMKYYDSTEKKFKETETATNIVKTGYILTNTQYEALRNEAANYTPIVIETTHKPDTTYYVVKTGFQVGDKWYSEGNQVTYDVYDGLSSEDKAKIDPITFYSLTGSTSQVSEIKRYYYCTKQYPAITGVTDINGSPHAAGSEINVGVIIPETGTGENKGYDKLVNEQKNFSIDGKTPTETSTLYVSREVDINKLSKDRIITVVYHYDYLESDDTGNSYEKIREYHVVNVHVHFESGMPTIGELLPPGTVLPDHTVTLNQPTVTKGAYEILGGGWEVFKDRSSADSHKNGVAFGSGSTPVYWYQDGQYVAYYALSYLGKSYSNAVPLSVANYHRMNDVLDVTNNVVTTNNNYMYLNEAVKAEKRNPKVYVKNDNELKKMATFFNQTLSESGLSDIKGCKKIDFIIDGDIEHTGSWTSIGREDNPATTDDESQCFEGTVHGDGHTISGLDNSLFKDLCGSVYNLGVTGSFKTAGVVDKGSGYVESAWVKSTATTTDADPKPYAVFGNPTDESGNQVVNSYYWSGNNALYNTSEDGTTSGGERGKARAMASRDFYNGTVAYDLNNFYLHKRHSLKNGTVDNNKQEGRYFTVGDDNKLTLQPYRSYANDPALCSTGFNAEGGTIHYVEERLADGDFRYAGGEIPTDEDERAVVVNEITGDQTFYPIWPDDYLFFGQKLTYGYSGTHQEVPTAVVKDEVGRLSLTESSNRVYRAPAYYRNSKMDVAHFNPNAYLAAKSSDGTKDVYPGMTAIDFAGHHEGHAASAYTPGLNAAGHFYPPLLDDDGLLSIVNKGETQNLLVYAPAATSSNGGYANEQTYDVLNDYFIGSADNRTEPLYNDYTESSDKYNDGKNYGRVAAASTASITGHLVQSNLKANCDHLLVDKQDFNAPFPYSFDDSHRMWYQRTPDDQEYVDRKMGWQGISLPFTAELVTTHQKGEITHFYSGSEASKNGTGTKIGHEYWLREFKGGALDKTDNTTYVAEFNYPEAPGQGDTKTVTNTFLWDYYYKGIAGGHDQKDKNTDTYQEYYRSSRSYEKYAFLTGGKPYLLGLPGTTYYEFDLSGKFEAQNTAVDIDGLVKQVITFASKTGTSIGKSDDETIKAQAGVTFGNYTFKPSYLNTSLAVGTDNYTLESEYDSNKDGNADCSRFGKVPDKGDAITVYAFRPFFTSASAGSRTRSIVFGNEQTELRGVEEHGNPKDEAAGGLNVYVLKNKIYVESLLSYATDVRIVTAAGISVSNFTVKPGQTIEVQADFSGMYIVHTVDGRYTKKVEVKK